MKSSRPFYSLCLIAVLCAYVIGVVGCDEPVQPSADMQMRRQQEVSQRQAVAQTGMPGITNYTEFKLVKHLYELRDSKIVTYSYVPDMNGRLWHLCNSIGYGLPYGVQYSNPEKITVNTGQSYGTLPQAEPNGLFMPPTAEGTWIMCSNPSKDGGIDPVYVEPRVIVSPFKLRADGEYAQR